VDEQAKARDLVTAAKSYAGLPATFAQGVGCAIERLKYLPLSFFVAPQCEEGGPPAKPTVPPPNGALRRLNRCRPRFREIGFAFE
jgi:hypothetical protein